VQRPLLCALLCAVFLAGCEVSVPALPRPKVVAAPGGSVTEALVDSIGPLNPLFERGSNEQDVDSLIYQGLTTVNARQQPAPQLASSWTLSDDHRTYTFQLRSGVRWADGVPFTADDVMFTFQVLQSPAYQEPGGAAWREIQVQKVAPEKVSFTLKAPSAAFPLALRQGIVPRHVFQNVPIDKMAADPHSNGRALGTGPFRAQSVSKDHKLATLVRNPYAAPKPYLDTFSFRSYATLADALDAVAGGEADAAGTLQPPQLSYLAKRPDLTVRELKTFTYVAVLFNLQPQLKTYFDPPSVRIALSQAVDRNALVKNVMGSHAQVSPGPIPPTSWAYAPAQAAKYPYDPRAAATALDKAGWVLDKVTGVRTKGGVPFSVTLDSPDVYPYRQVADAVSKQLKAIGVAAKVNPVPLSVLVEGKLVARDYQMALVAFDMGPDPDQYSLWHSDAPQGSLNFASSMIPRQALIDKDLEDGRATSDPTQRAASYADFQELMSDGAPGMFLFTPHYDYVLARRVNGVQINSVIDPVDRLQGAAGWYVDTRNP
jgi:peptide/nickel transport system substrate-binding protein